MAGDLTSAQLYDLFAELSCLQSENGYGFGLRTSDEIRDTITEWTSCPLDGVEPSIAEPDPFGFGIPIKKQFFPAMASAIVGNLMLSRAILANEETGGLEALSEAQREVFNRAKEMGFNSEGSELRLLELFFFAGGFPKPNVVAKLATGSRSSMNSIIQKLRERRQNPLRKFLLVPVAHFNGHNYPLNQPILTRQSQPLQECLYFNGNEYRAGNSLGLATSPIGKIHVASPAEVVAWFYRAGTCFSSSGMSYVNSNSSSWTPPANRWKTLLAAWGKVCDMQTSFLEGPPTIGEPDTDLAEVEF
jgi:hypothetical protein